MEDQERLYLRKLMVEERSRAIFFFNCYRPVVEQELSLIGEIENLQTILEDTVKQCVSPSNLPLIAEDSITNYKAQERAALPKTEKSVRICQFCIVCHSHSCQVYTVPAQF